MPQCRALIMAGLALSCSGEFCFLVQIQILKLPNLGVPREGERGGGRGKEESWHSEMTFSPLLPWLQASSMKSWQDDKFFHSTLIIPSFKHHFYLEATWHSLMKLLSACFMWSVFKLWPYYHLLDITDWFFISSVSLKGPRVTWTPTR